VKEEKLKTSDTIIRWYDRCVPCDENWVHNIDKYDESISAGSLY